MKSILKLTMLLTLSAGCASGVLGQVPDLLNAFDAGGRSLGMGGALHGTDPSSMSAYYNPASLGYITHGEVDLALHNLPNSTSSVSNTRANPVYISQGHSGAKAVTDVGVAMPVKALFGGGKASIALNYNVGGYVHDVATGPATGLTDGTVTLQGFQSKRTVQTDFVTLAYGQSTKSKTFAFGAGIVYAQNHLAFNESATSADFNGTPLPFVGADVDAQSHGIGLIVGGQYIPAFNPNFSLGVSYRTPIGLNSSSDLGGFDRIPGRVLADVSYRLPGYFDPNDYAIVAGQYQYFFNGDPSIVFDRSTQSVYGVGIEYDHQFSNFWVPIRIGYANATPGSLGFADGQAFTYGIGLRPLDSKYSLDFNWTTSQGGGKDFGISAGYRFGK